MFDGAGLRVLTPEECFDRLATVRVGRLALSFRALPLILPVHFQLEADRIVIHTTSGTTLHQTTDGTVVAFEAEGPVGVAEPTWSVALHGLAVQGSAGAESDPVRIDVSTDRISGRELLGGVPPWAQSCERREAIGPDGNTSGVDFAVGAARTTR